MGRLRRFRGAIAATIVLAAAGLVTGNAVVVLGSVIPLVYVAVSALSRVQPPSDEELSVTRSIDPTPTPPGRPVTVALTATNEGDRTLADVRLVDSVPRSLAVLGGSPRAGTTLEPGGTIEIEYTVVARRGEYAFEPPQVRVRGLGSSALTTTVPPADGDDTLICRLDADAPPIEEAGRKRGGQLTADQPGDGVTFHSSREYHPTDPARRINWRQYAKRGELATVNYDQQIAATVVLVLDARHPNRVVAGPGRPTGVELAAYAATRTLVDLLGDGHDVGVAIVGLDGDGPAGLHWLAPRNGRDQRSRAIELFRLATDAANESANEPEGIDRAAARRVTNQHRKLFELTPARGQLAVFSPLLDDTPVVAIERFLAGGVSTVVLSPDIVPENTVSGQYTQIRRRTRLARCQAAGARTVDWRRGTPLPLVIERAFAANATVGGQLSGSDSALPRPIGGDD